MGLAKDCLIEKCLTVSISSPVNTNRPTGTSISSSAEICLVIEVESITNLATSLNRPLFILTVNSPSPDPSPTKPYPPPYSRDLILLRCQSDSARRATNQMLRQWAEKDPPRTSAGYLANRRHRHQSWRQISSLLQHDKKEKKIGLGPFGVVIIGLGSWGILEPLVKAFWLMNLSPI
ncbi:unnamed protein product [Arabis nemorensis]|uniref:Uncharacterized protein n=1 Tax=Arabis nemorensis TaxID=586526 RepID=A0A565BRV2_9BRAS|nr:unnamed protein product [Arabis nemorensis]